MEKTNVTGRICGALVIAVMVVSAAGCGSDEDKAPTKAAFLKKGNAICTAGNKKIEAAGKKLSNGSRPDAATMKAFAAKTLVPGIQSQITAIRNLTPPKGDEKKVKAVLDSAQAALDKGKANPALLLQDAGPFAESNKLTTAYGLTVCGSG